MRTKENQVWHDEGVANWARQLIAGGWAVVYCDLPGNAKPPQIGKYVPDIYAKHGIEEMIIEVETSDSINSDHTKLQLSAFQIWKSQFANRRFLLKIV